MSTIKLRQFFQKPGFSTEAIHKLWISIYEASLADPKGSTYRPVESTPKNYCNNIEYLPIEHFKQNFSGTSAGPLIKHFLSSGTTSDQRSSSGFSADGLLLYKAEALLHFHLVMSQKLGPQWGKQPIHSLIPAPAQWPQSSLAQMIAWMSEFVPVIYSDQLCFEAATLGEKPITLFATAFHLIQLFDQAGEQPLAANSLVIETGGTKGKSRELNKADYYQLICQRLKIPRENIVSEYGMCELACQAYEWQAGSNDSSRTFRLPFWVQCTVTDGLQEQHNSGTGSLTVFDPLRIDYPFALRTQDLVELAADGQFNLLSRAKHAPLKGCSLLAETICEQKNTPTKKAAKNQTPSRDPLDLTTFEHRCQTLKHCFLSFITAPERLTELTVESKSITDSSMQQQSLLTQFEALMADPLPACLLAIGANKEKVTAQHQDWLFIPPGNHSLATIYPLCLAYLLEFKVKIRQPRHEFKFLMSFIHAMIHQAQAKFSTLEHRDLLTAADIPDLTEAILCFGENRTIKKIRDLSPVYVVGHGDAVAISCGTASQLAEDLPKIFEDAFSMRQQGCMSSRMLVCLNDSNWQAHDCLNHTSEALKEFSNKWPDFSDWQLEAAIEGETCRLQHRFGAKTLRANQAHPLLSCIQSGTFDAGMFAQVEFSLPIILWSGTTAELTKNLLTLPNIKTLLTNDTNLRDALNSNPDIECRRHGQGQLPPWNGLLHQRPVFFNT